MSKQPQWLSTGELAAWNVWSRGGADISFGPSLTITERDRDYLELGKRVMAAWSR